jgi:hypothetical protein
MENEEGTTSSSKKDTLNPEIDLIPEENFKEEDQKRIYGFTVGVVDPNAYQKVELSPRRFININNHIQGETRKKYIDLLKAYEKVFAWSHEDLKGIDLKYGQHRIDLIEGAIHIK